MMKSFAGARRPARWLAVFIGLVCAPPLLAEPLPFAGRWLLDDGSRPQAVYTNLTIKGESMSWSGSKKSTPGCVQQFVLKKENPGTVYLNGQGTKFVAGFKGSLPTYLLKLGASTCSSTAVDVRISYPLVYDTRHIDLIEYVDGKPVSSRRFVRGN
jgi:hypothetical protein